MNPMVMAMMIVLAVIASCSRSGGESGGQVTNPNAVDGVNALHRVEGPPLDRLTMAQIGVIVNTCFAHHDLDDVRVPYTRAYCERVFAERDRRAPVPGQRTVIVGGVPVKQVP
jgi:hypothetical protein